MRDHILIIANPIAGRGRGAQIAQRLKERLDRDGWRTDVSTERWAADELCDKAQGARAVIVIGGDGTVRTVADHLHRLQELPPLLPVPMGTANLMGRHLGMRWNDATVEAQVAAAIARRQIEWLDAATANGSLFLLTAGVGIDGYIVHMLDRIRNGPITYWSYTVPAASALGFYAYPPLTVVVDGQTVLKNRSAMAFVGNVSEHGLSFPLMPQARPDDRLLDVCVIPCSNRAQALTLFFHAAAGEHLMAEGVLYLTGKSIQIESSEQVPLQVDGEAAGHTPVDIQLSERKVPFLVPVF